MRFIVVGLVAAGAVALLAIWLTFSGNRNSQMQFDGPNAPLEAAISLDAPAAVRTAVSQGANVNAKSALGVTPLELAVGMGKSKAALALIDLGADPNVADVEGDTAVTLAVDRYTSNPELLRIVLDAGGNPNARRRDGDPVIVRFLNGADLNAISLMHSKGANLNATANGQPLLVFAAYRTDWDVVWHLIELGADLGDPQVQAGLAEAFNVPGATLPDSPLYPAKVKVYHRLRQLGLRPTPPAGHKADTSG